MNTSFPISGGFSPPAWPDAALPASGTDAGADWFATPVLARALTVQTGAASYREADAWAQALLGHLVDGGGAAR